jgi:hypothetical protein
VTPTLFPVVASFVSLSLGARLPCAHHVECERQTLCNYKSSIQCNFSLAIAARVPVVVQDLLRVDRHRNRCVVTDTPAVKEPFERDFEMLNRSVGIDKYNEFVMVEELVDYEGFDPRVMETFWLQRLGFEEPVVITVNLRCAVLARLYECVKLRVVAQWQWHAHTQLTIEKMVHERRREHAVVLSTSRCLPIQPIGAKDLVLARGRARVHINYYDVTAQGLLPSSIARNIKARAVRIDIGG